MSTPSILLIEDDPALASFLLPTLRMEGLVANLASNGAEALAFLDSSPVLPDLILTDLTMPVMDGLEFARRFHCRWGNRIPILLVTGMPDADHLLELFGFDAIIHKPFDLDALLATVHLILEPRPGATE